MAIHFLFNIKDDGSWNPGTVFFYNGSINRIQGVHNTEELKYISSIFEETTGRALKSYTWSSAAPVYVRVFGVLNPGGEDAVLNQLNALKATLDKAV